MSAAFGDRVFVYGGWRHEHELGDLRMLQIGPRARQWPQRANTAERSAGAGEVGDDDDGEEEAKASGEAAAAASACDASLQATSRAATRDGAADEGGSSSSESELFGSDEEQGEDDDGEEGSLAVPLSILQRYMMLRVLQLQQHRDE